MDNNESKLIGLFYGITAYILWGILPLYWKALDKITPMEILAHRILWSLVFVLVILCFQKKLHQFKEIFKSKSDLIRLIFATIFISINWGVYIWAVNTSHIVETSMGYYMNPLIVILLGVVVLKEKLNSWQIVSIIMATIGVGIMTFKYGEVPWISLTLALSFALYGLMKKTVSVGSTVGLAMETAILTPIALGYIIFRQVNGVGALGHVSSITTIILICSGIVTALPLLFFTRGTQRLPLSSMGYLQYIAPTISLILGIFVFKEEFTTTHFISFGFIWIGLAIFTTFQIRDVQIKRQRQEIETSKSILR
ncbi:MAG: chloramphenicol-sensitive protein RarD [Candidatus Frackibacter sp. T328-2]|nr:MAG: chloramphenicol-sensitive protein RarD [Candidatus Frackibacter sp. T328-2]